jgi:hypothetical protein
MLQRIHTMQQHKEAETRGVLEGQGIVNRTVVWAWAF